MNNYRLEIVEVTKNTCCLIYSKYFESDQNIKEDTYWRNNKCRTISKYNPTCDLKQTRKRKTKLQTQE